MDDNYDVLEKFRDLNGATLVKNYKANVKRPTVNAIEASSMSPCSNLDSDSDSDLERFLSGSKTSIAKKIRPKQVGSRLTESLPKKPLKRSLKKTSTSPLEIPDDTPVAKCLRSSLSLVSSNGSLSATNSTESNVADDKSDNVISKTLEEIQNIIKESKNSDRETRKKTRSSTSATCTYVPTSEHTVQNSRETGSSTWPDYGLTGKIVEVESQQQALVQSTSHIAHASRPQIVDSENLVSALAPDPAPRVIGYVSIDADSDDDTELKKLLNNTKKFSEIEEPFDLDNPTMNVKIIWHGKPEVFPLRKYQKFSSIFQDLAAREKADVNNVVLNIDDTVISPNDTPASINYRLYQFLSGRVMQKPLSGVVRKKRCNANSIVLKVQSQKWKQPLRVGIGKDEKLRILIRQRVFNFDGEYLNPIDTPMDLELEGGEILDMHIFDAVSNDTPMDLELEGGEALDILVDEV